MGGIELNGNDEIRGILIGQKNGTSSIKFQRQFQTSVGLLSFPGMRKNRKFHSRLFEELNIAGEA